MAGKCQVNVSDIEEKFRIKLKLPGCIETLIIIGF
ncbi:hypothetical protein ES708_28032 [subsurface metagenome]